MPRRDRTGGTLYERVTRALALYLLAPLLLLLALPVASHLASPKPGVAVHNLVIASVTPGGPAERAGLRAGDRLLAVDGQELDTMVDYYVATGGQRGEAPQRYLVRRGEERVDVQVTPARPARSRVIWAAGQYLSGLAFLSIGWWVLRRRRDAVARNFFGVCLIFAFMLMEVASWPNATYMTIREVTRDLLQLLLPAVFLRFFLYFPAPGPLAPQRRARHRLLLLPAAPLFLLSLYAQLARLDPERSFLVAAIQAAAFLYLFGYFIAGLLIFARKVLRRDRPVQQTKLRVVLLGLLVGLGPFMVGSFLTTVFPNLEIPHREWLGFSLGLVPLSFALAILRYGALDADYVVRHGLTYAGLTLALLIVYFLSVGLLGRFLTQTLGLETYPLAVLTVVVSALVVLPGRRVLQRWIDRAFYPAHGATRAAVADLGRELTRVIDTEGAARTLLERLSVLYAPQRLSLFLADAKGQQLEEAAVHTPTGPGRPVFKLPLADPLATSLLAIRRPVFAEELDDARDDEDDPESPPLPERLGCELYVPLVTGNRLTGLITFGAKRGGDLYTQDDVASLQLLAQQSAAQLENARLYRESLARERLEGELSVAQELQAHLIPGGSLDLPGAQLCGRMEACREVGGDYFDYFPLDRGVVGFAIADSSGKGVPAALLMSTLRVAFRTEAGRSRDPEQVVARLNAAVTDLDSPGQFISFFYGVFDIAAGRLRYCNAGMNPPLLFRGGRGWTEYLKLGGPVLGVRPDHRYRRGTVVLNEGDLLLLFSDGLTDEVNAAGEFFDLDRLVVTVRNHISSPLEELRDTIFAAVSAFGGTQRADDRTLMLLRVNPL